MNNLIILMFKKNHYRGTGFVSTDDNTHPYMYKFVLEKFRFFIQKSFIDINMFR